MDQFVKQFQHNESFYESLCINHADHYYDWKITCLFYAGFHLIKALASHRNVNIGNNHTEIFRNITPKNPKRILKIKDDIFYAYDVLFEYSRTARYDGFTDFDTFQIMKKSDLIDAIRRFKYIKKYIVEQGIIV